jgi:hypothetical protein
MLLDEANLLLSGRHIMRATNLLALLIFGIATIFVAPAVTTGQWGNKGGGKTGFNMDPGQLFDMMARGKPSISIADIRFGQSLAAQYAQQKGITNGMLNREQFIEFQNQMMAMRKGGGAKPEVKDSKLKELQKERLATTREFARLVGQRFKNRDGTLEEMMEATRILLEAELDVCDSDKERIAILEKFLGAARENERIATNLNKAGQGRESTALKAKTDRLQVEIALERAKVKPAVKPAEGNAAQDLHDDVALAEKQVAIKRAAVKVVEAQEKVATDKLATMKSLVVEARSFESYHEKQVKRLEELAKVNSVEERVVDERRAQWEAVKARRVTAERNVSEWESQVAVEQARVELARLEFEQAELRMRQLKARLRREG